jgi:molybdopterin synthase catalytic subunit
MGETAFAVVVTAVHRGPAFAACEEIVSTVKEELPIWKYQVFADGTNEWVNSA